MGFKHNNRSKSGGFTLIELLVVIAIIGILSAVVLSSLNSAREKGANASVMANLNTIRAQAELFLDTNGGYGTFGYGLCTNSGSGSIFQDPTILQALNAARAAAGDASLPAASRARCVSSATIYAVSVPLRTDTVAPTGTIDHWCVDSTGVSKIRGCGPITSNSCNAGC